MRTTNATALLDGAPITDEDAEQDVLGSILMNPDKLDDVALVLRPEDFYSARTRLLYRTMLDMRNAGKGVDIRLLTSAMTRAGTLADLADCPSTATSEDIRGAALAYIGHVAESVPSAANAVYYAEHVRDCSLLRSLAYAGSEMISEAYKGDGAPRERVARAEGKVLSLLEHGSSRNVRPIRDVLHDAIAEIDARATRGSVAGLTTGFSSLDALLGGMRPGELIIVAGRPSHGKSAIASNIVENVSIHSGMTTLFVSLEMTGTEMADRMLASVSLVSGSTIRGGRLTPEERTKVVHCSAAIAQSPMFVDDSPQRNMVEISSAARRLKRTDNLALLVIDYLQLIEPDNRREPREQQVAVISRRLKQLAREIKIPVMCLAQLNRQSEATGDRIPKLSNLRESGSIEQDADVVLFVHREDMYQPPDQWDHKALIRVAKNRNGQRGETVLDWNAACTRFDPPSTAWNPSASEYPGAEF